MNASKLAVYTTVYPSVETYFKDWYTSLLAQSDTNFDLWIGIDSVEPQVVERWVGEKIKAYWVRGEEGATPAEIRSAAFEEIVDVYDAVVLVDSDDVMDAGRVHQTRIALKEADLVGCSLKLINESGGSLGEVFGLMSNENPEDVFPWANLFGLSNSAYKCDLLNQLIPVPAEIRLVDWYLATKTWLLGKNMTFMPEVLMSYRQHGANMAGVLPPFDKAKILIGAEWVLQHYNHLLSEPLTDYLPDRVEKLKKEVRYVKDFAAQIFADSEKLEAYLQNLNAMQSTFLWWDWIAHPSWRDIGTAEKEPG